MPDPNDPRQCWRTPPELWEQIRRRFGCDFDSAANAENHLTDQWCGPGHLMEQCRDGLHGTIPFIGSLTKARVYCNPGFGNIKPWLARWWTECDDGNITLAVTMVHVQTSARWWSEYVASKPCEVYVLTPRVQFIRADGVKQSSNSHDNALVVYRRGCGELTGGPVYWTWRWK